MPTFIAHLSQTIFTNSFLYIFLLKAPQSKLESLLKYYNVAILISNLLICHTTKHLMLL